MSQAREGPFNPFDFTRIDESDDALFYRDPRLVVHIDDQAIAAVGRLFRELIPADSEVLDLMSSWRSHWPGTHGGGAEPPHPKKRLVGLGLNAVEMQENPDLDEHIVHDVNKDPRLPFADRSFDAAVITVSVQYLTSPVAVFRNVSRVLRPGGPFLVAFSNRMFHEKATLIWRMKDDRQRMELVEEYFRLASNYGEAESMCRNPRRHPMEDPIYLVIARRES